MKRAEDTRSAEDIATSLRHTQRLARVVLKKPIWNVDPDLRADASLAHEEATRELAALKAREQGNGG